MNPLRIGVPAAVFAAMLAAWLAPSLYAAAPTPLTSDGVTNYDRIRPQADFTRREVMLPMRDGVKLYTVIFMKKGAQHAPLLLSRTPYDARGSTSRSGSQTLTEVLPVMDAEFVADNYIRVYQDIRGLHGSEGDYVTDRPLRGPLNDTTTDESTDAWDTIDWLVKNVPEGNGKVGVIGTSYLGFTTLMAEIDPHPALKAAVPESPMVDGWIGDDYFHNGAFRSTNIDYDVGQGTERGAGSSLPVGARDDYSRYLEAGSVGDYVHYWGADVFPDIQRMLQHPAYDEYWSSQALDKILATRPLTVPTMLIVGQWDQEDSYGAPAVFKAWKPRDTGNLLSLVIGPWRHSGVNHYGFGLGALTFTGDTAQEFRVKYLKPFLDHWLKGAPDPHTPVVLTYATGENHWNASPRWPAGSPVKLYLRENFALSFEPPDAAAIAAAGIADTSGVAGSDHDSYVSDPSKPIPFTPRPIHMNDEAQWQTWLVQDQRFASARPDVLVYEGPVLDKPVHIMGPPQVELFAATTGTDSDFAVKLIDVFPDYVPEPDQTTTAGFAQLSGSELPIGIEIFRGRYVHGFDKPQPLTPGKIEEYRFGLPSVDHVFLRGHRIMVQVQSTLFPLYDRNPQTFVDNIFFAKPGDYRSATQSVYHSAAAASAIVLPVVPAVRVRN